MSDFYLCEHKQQCCGSCIRGAKTENNRLESSLAEARAEIEQLARIFDSGVKNARADALEEAAKIADINDGRTPGSCCEQEAKNIAYHIRALKEKS